MAAETPRNGILIPDGKYLSDGDAYQPDGPTPEILETEALTQIRRYEKFFNRQPLNTAGIALRDIYGAVWTVTPTYEDLTTFEQVVISTDSPTREVRIILRRPNDTREVNYPFEVEDQQAGLSEKNSYWTIARVKAVSDDLLKPFEQQLEFKASQQSQEDRETADKLKAFSAAHKKIWSDEYERRARQEREATQSDQLPESSS